MRIFSTFIILMVFFSCKEDNQLNFADNPVIAHRGAWKTKNLPENSIAALKEAIRLNCYGSEFDVRMTKDSVLIVTHDNEYNNLLIAKTNYNELAEKKLSNGEVLPTLKEFILAGMKNNTSTGLVLEIKPTTSKERNIAITDRVLALVEDLEADKYIASYISFSLDILKRIVEQQPNAKTQYLDGSKSPEQLKKLGISGLDYLAYKFKKRPHWINSAKEHNLTLNAWTVNTTEDIDWLLANNFNYITTNEPELVFERLKKSPTQKGYQLVWSDEFNYIGKPYPTKWNFQYGFIANRENQYYTDSLKNARVEEGTLIIEAHKETIKNKDYNNSEILKKSWKKYAAERKVGKYTSARLTTKDLASWKYGRIEVSAKLPKGTGMWPAIWMLGDNKTKVGWPEAGEIDIMEHVGFNNDSIFGTVHTKAFNHMKNTQKGKSIFINNPNNKFNTFAIEWTPEKIDFILNDIVYNTFANEHKTTAEWPFDQKFYLILNVAVGGMLGGRKGIDDSIFPQRMVVDYVRIYQKENYK
ncbi:glycerophosphodiester phosphodiesterase family protein [Polaribacter porphyrae]|uniref:Licheninase n=1 Tax=Polaribacter porphyrae TaxID=1137780 RepID=A0A2S7WSV2_9FLAO|nr:family 16 glycosylhydrolase [Polaribacter porphyrae]PQJ80536.1 licheninase [Polaribacter porphyrae]